MEVQTGTGLFLHFSGKISKHMLECAKNIGLNLVLIRDIYNYAFKCFDSLLISCNL